MTDGRPTLWPIGWTRHATGTSTCMAAGERKVEVMQAIRAGKTACIAVADSGWARGVESTTCVGRTLERR